MKGELLDVRKKCILPMIQRRTAGLCAGMVECVVILPPLHPARYSVPRPARQTKSAGFDICRNKLERARGGRRTLQRTVGQHWQLR